MDDPLEIVNGAIDQHRKMIKQMKGVPGIFVLFTMPENICLKGFERPGILPLQDMRLWHSNYFAS